MSLWCVGKDRSITFMREDARSPLEILITEPYTFEKNENTRNYEELGIVSLFLNLSHEQVNGKVS